MRPDRSLVDPLAKVLAGDPGAEVRAAAAEAMGGIEDPRVTPALLRAVDDEAAIVRSAAVRALGKTAAELTRHIESIKDKRKAADALLAVLEDAPADAAVLPWAAEMLGSLGDRRAVQPLVGLLQETSKPGGNARACAAAARALAKLADRRAVKPLTKALKNKHPAVRLSAAEALGRVPDERAVAALAEALWDADAAVRLAATRALVKIGPPAVEPLGRLLEANEQALRRAALRATGSSDVNSLVAAWKKDPRLRAEATKALRTDPGTLNALAGMLEGRHGATRRLAARMLGRLGGRQAAKVLVASLEQEDGLLRLAARDALVRIGPAAVGPLIPALKHKDVNVRRAAVDALGRIGGARALEPLTAALADTDWMVRYRAALRLGELGDKRAREPLRIASTDKNQAVRRAAAEALKKLQP